tara:strand:+ start:309 stop:965 length:657 start_codon:yes stop_codon:yes gene_type:complete
MKSYRQPGLWICARVVLFVSAILLLGGVSFAGGSPQLGGDSLFENQILSMTAPKPELKPSGDPRFKDNEDGTVTDLEEGLMWQQQDSYQEKKQWINWVEARGYVRKKNENKFAGYEDWRLPTRQELLTLYEEDKSIPWPYYWTTNEVHIDPIFGYTSCCFWTSEAHKDIYAWHVNFIRGKAYPSIKQGVKNMAAGSASLSVVRPVRDVGTSSEAGVGK